jgi:hypothetical protein
MSTAMVRSLLWRVVRRLHRLDFRHVLPWLARLPLPLAYALAGLRSRIMASTTLDWRSIALGYRHIRLQSPGCAAALLPAQVPTPRARRGAASALPWRRARSSRRTW